MLAVGHERVKPSKAMLYREDPRQRHRAAIHTFADKGVRVLEYALD
jgi:hypothetical protein